MPSSANFGGSAFWPKPKHCLDRTGRDYPKTQHGAGRHPLMACRVCRACFSRSESRVRSKTARSRALSDNGYLKMAPHPSISITWKVVPSYAYRFLLSQDKKHSFLSNTFFRLVQIFCIASFVMPRLSRSRAFETMKQAFSAELPPSISF
jgi:hypothetical protein